MNKLLLFIGAAIVMLFVVQIGLDGGDIYLFGKVRGDDTPTVSLLLYLIAY